VKTKKYQRLVDEFEGAIRDGAFAPGARLPSVRDLMGMHQLSLSTVTTALALLEERGLIEPRARDLLTLPTKKEILRLAGEHGCTLIEDDSTGDLHFDHARPLPIKALDRSGNVVYVSAATRTIAPGLQLGWIVSGAERRVRMEQVKSISASAVDHLPQLVMAEFLARGSHLPHLRKLRAALKRRAQEFERVLQPVLGAVCGLTGRRGGYNRFLRVPGRTLDPELERAWAKHWPGLASSDRPMLRIKEGGVSVNLSFALEPTNHAELRAFGRQLADLAT
jgi:DNA-binding transcriptional MocR family regulator